MSTGLRSNITPHVDCVFQRDESFSAASLVGNEISLYFSTAVDDPLANPPELDCTESG